MTANRKTMSEIGDDRTMQIYILLVFIGLLISTTGMSIDKSQIQIFGIVFTYNFILFAFIRFSKNVFDYN